MCGHAFGWKLAPMKRWLTCLIASVPLCATAMPRERQDLAATLKLRADAERGREIFAKCAACHGVDGGGEISGSIPRIGGQHRRVLVRQLVDFRNGQRWDIRMEGVATSHEVIPELQDIADVALFVSQLTRDGQPGIGNGDNLEQGATVYARACASCHGTGGEGEDARGIPRLAGQHAGYLSRQIYDAVDGRRPGLSRTHGARFTGLDFAQVLGLADYIARMAPPGAPPNASR
jgi:cytochrome c553